MSEYNIVSKPFGAYTQLSLINNKSGAKVSLIPEFGANVNELVLVKNKTPYSVLDGDTNAAMLTENRWYKGAKLSPFANRIEDGNYTFEGKNYQLPINFPEQHHAIHGLVYCLPFTVAHQQCTQNSVSVSLTLQYTNTIAGYPFPFYMAIDYSLHGDKYFSCTTRVKNMGLQAMPFADGWHPYFTLCGAKADELQLQLPPCHEIETDERQIPIGKLLSNDTYEQFREIGNVHLDTGFVILQQSGKINSKLRLPEEDITLNVWQEVGQNAYAFLQVFTPPNRKSIALEPMTAAANAFNNGLGLQILAPGTWFRSSYGVMLN